MSEPISAQMLFDQVSGDLRSMVSAEPIGALTGKTRTATSSIKRMRRGEAPARTVNFLWTLKRLGTAKARRILRPIIGRTDLADAVLDLGRTMETASHDFARAVAALPAGALDQMSRLSAEASLREGGRALDAAAAGRAPLALAAAAAPGRVHAAARAASIDLVAIRRSFGEAHGTGLEGHVAASSGIATLDAARRYARGSSRIGLAYRPPGADDWTIEPAADNRFWRGAEGPVPVTAFPDPAQVDGLRRGFVEAIAERRVLIEHTGWDDGRHVHAVIARLGGVADDGTEMVLAPFERLAA